MKYEVVSICYGASLAKFIGKKKGQNKGEEFIGCSVCETPVGFFDIIDKKVYEELTKKE